MVVLDALEAFRLYFAMKDFRYDFFIKYFLAETFRLCFAMKDLRYDFFIKYFLVETISLLILFEVVF